MKLLVQAIMGAIAFAIWSFMAYHDPSLRSAYLTAVISVATGVTAIVLRDMPTDTRGSLPQPSTDSTTTTKEP